MVRKKREKKKKNKKKRIRSDEERQIREIERQRWLMISQDGEENKCNGEEEKKKEKKKLKIGEKERGSAPRSDKKR